MNPNPDQYCLCLMPAALAPNDQATVTRSRAALLNQYRWGTGARITVRFLEGDDALCKRVEAVAGEWMRFANVILDFRKGGPTEVRIAFKPGKGSWSYLGTYCRKIPEPQATMNYGWLTPVSTDDVLRRVVLHEFGHALGLIHEHQNPKGGIKWNRDAVKRDLSGPPNNWDNAKIENNMFKHYALGEVNATDVDSKSIMMYPIPASWTTNGFSAGMNKELSEHDKMMIRQAYPK